MGKGFKLEKTADWDNAIKETTFISIILYFDKCRCITIAQKLHNNYIKSQHSHAWRCNHVFDQILQWLSHSDHINCSINQWYYNCIIVQIYTKSITVNFLLSSFFNFWSLTYVKESILTYKFVYKTFRYLRLYYICLWCSLDTCSLCWARNSET